MSRKIRVEKTRAHMKDLEKLAEAHIRLSNCVECKTLLDALGHVARGLGSLRRR